MKCVVVIAALLGVILAQGDDLPPFLKDAPAAVINDFKALVNNAATKTDAQADADMDAWVAKQSPKIKADYAAFKKEIDSGRVEGEKAHQAAIAHFSAAAKKADADLIAVFDDAKLTQAQKEEKANAIMGALPEAVRKELQTAAQG